MSFQKFRLAHGGARPEVVAIAYHGESHDVPRFFNKRLDATGGSARDDRDSAEPYRHLAEKGRYSSTRGVGGRIPDLSPLPRNRLRLQAPVVAALLYLITPIDFIPDFLPGVGFVDDRAVLTGVIGLLKLKLNEAQTRCAQQGRNCGSCASE